MYYYVIKMQIEWNTKKEYQQREFAGHHQNHRHSEEKTTDNINITAR